MDNFVAEKYLINEEAGREYNHLITARITNMVSSGILTTEEAEAYSLQTYMTRSFLREGHWNSA